MTAITQIAAPTRIAYVLAGVAASALATSAVAFAARAAGASPDFAPLQPQAYLTFATAGTLLAILGWVLVVRLARRPARLLRVLVPTLLVLSLVPDVVLLFMGFIPNTNPVAVFGLMLMHPIVAGVAVLVGQRIAPANAGGRE